MFRQIAFDLRRKVFFQFFFLKIAIQQEGTAVPDILYHVIFMEVYRIVACHEVGTVNQVGGTDWKAAKAQVGYGQSP